MPKTIDYPRTTYLSAWEIAEVVDDTGGKCAIETCARKLSRKVSGSFKAIIGSAVKFGLVTSKRELLTTTNLFRRIKHAYDKQEEKVFHREAFLNPPLFTQICRKFRNRELPVHMFDVMLIREFGVEEINAQNVAKAFVDGARMTGILDERNVVADIDQLAAQQTPRRELASTEMPTNLFKAATPTVIDTPADSTPPAPTFVPPLRGADAVSSLFGLNTLGLDNEPTDEASLDSPVPFSDTTPQPAYNPGTSYTKDEKLLPTGIATPQPLPAQEIPPVSGETSRSLLGGGVAASYSIRISGPGIDTQLTIQDADDLQIVSILLDKMRKRLSPG